MKCPTCQEVNLLMSERQGIEIDYCPQCRGVWLDRGELDKFIERSNLQVQATPQMPEAKYKYQERGDASHPIPTQLHEGRFDAQGQRQHDYDERGSFNR